MNPFSLTVSVVSVHGLRRQRGEQRGRVTEVDGKDSARDLSSCGGDDGAREATSFVLGFPCSRSRTHARRRGSRSSISCSVSTGGRVTAGGTQQIGGAHGGRGGGDAAELQRWPAMRSGEHAWGEKERG